MKKYNEILDLIASIKYDDLTVDELKNIRRKFQVETSVLNSLITESEEKNN